MGEVGLANEGVVMVVVVVMRMVGGEEEENCVCQKLLESNNGYPTKPLSSHNNTQKQCP